MATLPVDSGNRSRRETLELRQRADRVRMLAAVTSPAASPGVLANAATSASRNPRHSLAWYSPLSVKRLGGVFRFARASPEERGQDFQPCRHRAGLGAGSPAVVHEPAETPYWRYSSGSLSHWPQYVELEDAAFELSDDRGVVDPLFGRERGGRDGLHLRSNARSASDPASIAARLRAPASRRCRYSAAPALRTSPGDGCASGRAPLADSTARRVISGAYRSKACMAGSRMRASLPRAS